MVDHLFGFIDENDSNAWNEEVLFPLCNKCHSIVTALEKTINFIDYDLESAIFVKYGSSKIDLNQVLL